MKEELRTYGVRGYLEYEALIPAGTSHIRIRFEGGSITGYGVAPAMFSTRDPALQYIIEQSPQWKRGIIVRCRPVEP